MYRDLHFVPDPMQEDKQQGHFKPFEDVYGHPTDDHARPSYSAALERHNEQDVVHRQLLVGPKVRDVHCTDCNKPRCVYAATKHMICLAISH